jgi:DNA-binding transcriptional MerR regulator
MPDDRSFTLSEVARGLDVPQHRLIHLCEKGVVVPDVRGAAGRGSSRVFSSRNVLELAVALRLRGMMLPVAAVGSIIHVLGAFEQQVREELPEFSLPGSLKDGRAPDLRVIVSDGQTIYFSLGMPNQKPRLFGGIPLTRPPGDTTEVNSRIDMARFRGNAPNSSNGLGPEGSQFARLELSVTAIAQTLRVD